MIINLPIVAAATNRFVVEDIGVAEAGGAGEGTVVVLVAVAEVGSTVLRGLPMLRRAGEVDPSGFLKAAAAAAFLVNNTAVRRFTPEGDPLKLAFIYNNY